MNTAIIIGLLLIVLFLCLYIAFIKGYRITKPAATTVKIPDEEKRKADNLQKEFDEVISYNLSKALERKRV